MFMRRPTLSKNGDQKHDRQHVEIKTQHLRYPGGRGRLADQHTTDASTQ
jgi:hypothetical protein